MNLSEIDTRVSLIIKDFENLHLSLRVQMGNKRRNKKWCIWLLQGLGLSNINHYLDSLRNHDTTQYMGTSRMSSEIVELISFFNTKGINKDWVNDWFDGDLYSAPSARDYERIAKKRLKIEDTVFKLTAIERSNLNALIKQLKHVDDLANKIIKPLSPELNDKFKSEHDIKRLQRSNFISITSQSVHPTIKHVDNMFFYGASKNTDYMYDTRYYKRSADIRVSDYYIIAANLDYMESIFYKSDKVFNFDEQFNSQLNKISEDVRELTHKIVGLK
ncbi:MAG: hypothetical protein V4611_04560 [Patescibacteria group bacterium]